MDLHIALILAYFTVFWIQLDSTSTAQEISIKPTAGVDQSSPNSQTTPSTGTDALSASGGTLASRTPKRKTKTLKFEHNGMERQEFTAYANFSNPKGVSFIARQPSDKCLDIEASINKIVLYFGDLDCSTSMMWAKSGFFWGKGDSEMMSHLPTGSKDVRVSLSNKNVYLVGEDKNKATEIFVCPINESITTIGFLFEKSADNILPKGCKITLVLSDSGFVDRDDITALSSTLPITTTDLTTLASARTTTTTIGITTIGITRKTRPIKSTTAMTTTTPKTTTINSTKAHSTIHSSENGTSKKGIPNAHISTTTKKAPIDAIRVPSTVETDNGAKEYSPWAVISISLLFLIIPLY